MIKLKAKCDCGKDFNQEEMATISNISPVNRGICLVITCPVCNVTDKIVLRQKLVKQAEIKKED